MDELLQLLDGIPVPVPTSSEMVRDADLDVAHDDAMNQWDNTSQSHSLKKIHNYINRAVNRCTEQVRRQRQNGLRGSIEVCKIPTADYILVPHFSYQGQEAHCDVRIVKGSLTDHTIKYFDSFGLKLEVSGQFRWSPKTGFVNRTWRKTNPILTFSTRSFIDAKVQEIISDRLREVN